MQYHHHQPPWLHHKNHELLFFSFFCCKSCGVVLKIEICSLIFPLNIIWRVVALYFFHLFFVDTFIEIESFIRNIHLIWKNFTQLSSKRKETAKTRKCERRQNIAITICCTFYIRLAWTVEIFLSFILFC